MGQHINWYKEVLKKNGIKNTVQKEAILNVLIIASSHLSVEEIYKQIRDIKIGLATIYRNLKQFRELGIVKEIPMDGIRYYELKLFGKKPLHIHFKCVDCNTMSDIDDTEINLEYIRLHQKIENKMDVEVNDANITLLGVCKGCKDKINSGKMITIVDQKTKFI